MKRRNFISLLSLAAAPIPVFAGYEVKKLTEFDEFLLFFREHNGFPASTSQKDFSRGYFEEGNSSYFYTRNWGKSTLLLSLSLWEAKKGLNVVFCSPIKLEVEKFMFDSPIRDCIIKSRTHGLLKDYVTEIDFIKGGCLEFEYHSRNTDAWRGQNYDRIFYDFDDLWQKYDVLKPAITFNKGILVGDNCILKA